MNLNKDYFSELPCVMLLVLSLTSTVTGASMHAGEANGFEQDKAWVEALKSEQRSVNSSLNNEDKSVLVFPTDDSCWQVHQVVMMTRAKDVSLDFLQPLIQQAQGKCLGHNGITFLANKLHNELVRHGYIASSVVTPSQNLRSGTLKYKINPGRVGDNELTTDSYRYLTMNNPRPLYGNDILNHRNKKPPELRIRGADS